MEILKSVGVDDENLKDDDKLNLKINWLPQTRQYKQLDKKSHTFIQKCFKSFQEYS
jgi:hypothetical protein